MVMFNSTSSRRNFIKKGVLITGITVADPVDLISIKKKPLVGIQLYSVRDAMAKDAAGTLQELSAMGYTNVEHAGYTKGKFYGYSAGDFQKLLNGLGLKMPAGHTVLGSQHWNKERKEFTDEWKQTVEDAAYVGQEFVISPWLDQSLRQSYDELLRFLEVFNKCGELCQKSGMKYGYHNHDFEFSQVLNGKTVYEIILTNTDPSLVIQQLDMGNLYNGGAKTSDIIKKYPGRFESLHVKDEIKIPGHDDKYESTVLGDGIIDVRQNLKYLEKDGGVKHMIIEQEAYQGKDPLQCARENLQKMKLWGYV